MQPSGDTAAVAAGLRRIVWRISARQWTVAGALASASGALVFALLAMGGAGVSASIAGALAFAAALLALRLIATRPARTLASAARAIEFAHPSSRNVVITAEELLRHPERARPDVQSRVFDHANRMIAETDPSAAVPLTRPVLIAVAAIVFAGMVGLGIPAGHTRMVASPGSQSGAASPSSSSSAFSIAATIAPPAYTGEPPRTIDNPDRIEAVEGSRLRLAMRGAKEWRVRFGAAPLEQRPDANEVTVELMLTESSYLAIEPITDAGSEERRLVPVVVTPDRSPTIRIDAPGKDLLLPDAKPTVKVEASATDDFGMASLDLRYTKISGSGEQYEFQEGTIPLRIASADARSWRAAADMALGRLGLSPGDSLVYRVVGRDRRPGDAGLASSDTFFLEIAGPGQVALEGFELPPDRERYALSQQMIVLKLERLRARERSIERPALEQEVANIAAEQRAVRANFIFLTGGTVEDEEEEAEHSHEIQEGRLQNTARQEIVRAIQFMGRVELELAAVNAAGALPPARAAVDALQKAFGRNRYFLRTVPVRSRIDPSRRLSGNLTEAGDWRRELFPAIENDMAARSRRLMSRLIELSPDIKSRTLPAAALTAAAEEAIAIDPSSTAWQAVARRLTELRDARNDSVSKREQLLDQSVGAIATMLQAQANAAVRSSGPADPLRSAWQDSGSRK